MKKTVITTRCACQGGTRTPGICDLLALCLMRIANFSQLTPISSYPSAFKTGLGLFVHCCSALSRSEQVAFSEGALDWAKLISPLPYN